MDQREGPEKKQGNGEGRGGGGGLHPEQSIVDEALVARSPWFVG